MDETIRVLWLKPARWKNVSVRRQRIAEKLERRGLDIDLIPATMSNSIRYGLRAVGGRYDIVIGNVHMGVFAGYCISRLSRLPFIAEVTDFIEDIDHLPTLVFRLLYRYEQFALRHANAIVFLPETHKWWAEHHGLDGAIAGNAVDFDLFNSPDETAIDRAEEILREHGVDLDRPIAIYHGTLPDGDAKLDEKIAAARASSKWQFVLLGEGPMTDELEQLSEQIVDLYYLGAFEYELVPGFLHHADAGLCLESVERPLKISEFGAANLPTLGTFGKLEEEFPHDELFYVGIDSDEILCALDTIRSDPEEATASADRLREHVKEYSWAGVASTYYDLIEDLVG